MLKSTKTNDLATYGCAKKILMSLKPKLGLIRVCTCTCAPTHVHALTHTQTQSIGNLPIKKRNASCD